MEMGYFMKNDGWNPFVAGALAGLLAILSVYVTQKMINKSEFLGTSTTFVRVTGLVEKAVVPEHVASNDYFTSTKVKVDWQMLLVVGVFIGALISSVTDGSFKIEPIPPLWKQYHGGSIINRAIWSILGGIVALFGVRMAGGCPSGHGLSGMMQLATSGLVAMGGFMAGGFVVARIVNFKKKGAGND